MRITVMNLLLLTLFLSVVGAATTHASPNQNENPAQVTVFPGSMTVKPGQWFPVAIVIDMKPKWHIQTNAPVVPKALGSPEDYIKTSIASAKSADGRLLPNVGAIQWPKPMMANVAFAGTPVEYGVFGGRILVYLPVFVAADASPGVGEIAIKLTYQACDDRICIAPVDLTFPVKVAVHPDAKGWPAVQTYPEYFTGFDASALPAPASMAASVATGASTSSSGINFGMMSLIIAGAAILVLGLVVVVAKKLL